MPENYDISQSIFIHRTRVLRSTFSKIWRLPLLEQLDKLLASSPSTCFYYKCTDKFSRVLVSILNFRFAFPLNWLFVPPSTLLDQLSSHFDSFLIRFSMSLGNWRGKGSQRDTRGFVGKVPGVKRGMQNPMQDEV